MKENKAEQKTERELFHSVFLQREYEKKHLPYEKELSFYEAVKNGDMEHVRQIMLPLEDSQLGNLSDSPLRNLKYHLIITIALVTRFCIEGGLEPETGYTLSDLYIQKADKCQTIEEVSLLHKQVIFDFTKRMRKITQRKIQSKPVILCIDYIYDHLHSIITIQDLADYVKLNPTYLASLFKNEVGVPIALYIRTKRIEASQNMLKYSDYSYADISNYLAFNSHSHFISVFKKQVGITPKEYRNRYFRNNWTQ